MAGAGYKLFNTGDVLTAAQVNTYLQEQVVMVFANSTARTTALSGVLAEGMMSYLQDTDLIQYYNGSTWVTVNTDQTPLTTKGDLFTYSTTDARLAVGNNGETLVADSSATTGLSYQANWAAGKNKIINGDMRIWQRGTSLALTSAQAGFLADRWSYYVGSTGAATISQQSFTAGTAPVAGYEAPFFLRMNQTTGTSGNPSLTQKIEDVRTFANQTVTVSFWMKASGSLNIAGVNLQQDFGSGGSAAVTTTVLGSTAITTSWTRYSATISNPSISGKTIGTGSNLQLQFILPGSSTFTIDLWGVQVEAGSVATAFQTATGTLAGELDACMRYYQRFGGASNTPIVFGGTSSVVVTVPNINKMRTTPTMSTTLTNASYNSAVGAGQWAVGIDGTGYGTKTGTITVNLRNWGVSFTGATYSTTPPNFLATGDSTLYFEASAEL